MLDRVPGHVTQDFAVLTAQCFGEGLQADSMLETLTPRFDYVSK